MQEYGNFKPMPHILQHTYVCLNIPSKQTQNLLSKLLISNYNNFSKLGKYMKYIKVKGIFSLVIL